jgi:NAD-dependent deacetylase
MNVDGLHQASGSDPNHVHEIHGSIRKFRCGVCNVPMNDIITPDTISSKPIRCQNCKRGFARPDVTLFTESLPQSPWIEANRAVQGLGVGDVLLIVGTSSVVYPAAYLPEMAKQQGATLIEVNPSMETPLHKITDVHIPLGAADALVKLSEKIFECNSNTM